MSLAGVLLILLLVYRSVVMPALVLAAALLALAMASPTLYALVRAGWLTFDGQVQGIVFVLVIGATTSSSSTESGTKHSKRARCPGFGRGSSARVV